MLQKSWLGRRVVLPTISVRTGLLVVVIFFALAVGTSIILSDDPNWARWHISYLGEGIAMSAHVFNWSMMIGGVLLAWFGVLLYSHLAQHGGQDEKGRRIRARFIFVHFMIIALCVYLVGLFPRSFGIYPHDIFGHLIYFSFLSLCMSAPWALPGMKKWFYILSYAFHVIMLLLFLLYWTGVSESLYLAEVATFVFFVGWTTVLMSQHK